MATIKKKSKVGSHQQVGPTISTKKEFERDYGDYSIAKIISVHEDLGLVVGLFDEKTTGVIPIEWFIKKNETYVPNGLACPYIYDYNLRQWATNKYEEIKEKIGKEKENEITG